MRLSYVLLVSLVALLCTALDVAFPVDCIPDCGDGVCSGATGHCQCSGPTAGPLSGCSLSMHAVRCWGPVGASLGGYSRFSTAIMSPLTIDFGSACADTPENCAVIDVASTDAATCAVLKSGSVACVGDAKFLNLLQPSVNHTNDVVVSPTELPEIATAVAIDSSDCAMVITAVESGYVRAYCVGTCCYSDTGTVNLPASLLHVTDAPILPHISASSVGYAVWGTLEGETGTSIYVWGRMGQSIILETPAFIDIPHDVRDLSCGHHHCCAIADEPEAIADGAAHLYCWGESLFGEFGDGVLEQDLGVNPSHVSLARPALSVACGLYITCLTMLDESSTWTEVYCVGNNRLGQISVLEHGASPDTPPSYYTSFQRLGTQYAVNPILIMLPQNLDAVCLIAYNRQMACVGSNQVTLRPGSSPPVTSLTVLPQKYNMTDVRTYSRGYAMCVVTGNTIEYNPSLAASTDAIDRLSTPDSMFVVLNESRNHPVLPLAVNYVFSAYELEEDVLLSVAVGSGIEIPIPQDFAGLSHDFETEIGSSSPHSGSGQSMKYLPMRPDPPYYKVPPTVVGSVEVQWDIPENATHQQVQVGCHADPELGGDLDISINSLEFTDIDNSEVACVSVRFAAPVGSTPLSDCFWTDWSELAYFSLVPIVGSFPQDLAVSDSQFRIVRTGSFVGVFLSSNFPKWELSFCTNPSDEQTCTDFYYRSEIDTTNMFGLMFADCGQAVDSVACRYRIAGSSAMYSNAYSTVVVPAFESAAAPSVLSTSIDVTAYPSFYDVLFSADCETTFGATRFVVFYTTDESVVDWETDSNVFSTLERSVYSTQTSIYTTKSAETFYVRFRCGHAYSYGPLSDVSTVVTPPSVPTIVSLYGCHSIDDDPMQVTVCGVFELENDLLPGSSMLIRVEYATFFEGTIDQWPLDERPVHGTIWMVADPEMTFNVTLPQANYAYNLRIEVSDSQFTASESSDVAFYATLSDVSIPAPNITEAVTVIENGNVTELSISVTVPLGTNAHAIYYCFAHNFNEFVVPLEFGPISESSPGLVYSSHNSAVSGSDFGLSISVLECSNVTLIAKSGYSSDGSYGPYSSAVSVLLPGNAPVGLTVTEASYSWILLDSSNTAIIASNAVIEAQIRLNNTQDDWLALDSEQLSFSESENALNVSSLNSNTEYEFRIRVFRAEGLCEPLWGLYSFKTATYYSQIDSITIEANTESIAVVSWTTLDDLASIDHFELRLKDSLPCTGIEYTGAPYEYDPWVTYAVVADLPPNSLGCVQVLAVSIDGYSGNVASAVLLTDSNPMIYLYPVFCGIDVDYLIMNTYSYVLSLYPIGEVFDSWTNVTVDPSFTHEVFLELDPQLTYVVQIQSSLVFNEVEYPGRILKETASPSDVVPSCYPDCQNGGSCIWDYSCLCVGAYAGTDCTISWAQVSQLSVPEAPESGSDVVISASVDCDGSCIYAWFADDVEIEIHDNSSVTIAADTYHPGQYVTFTLNVTNEMGTVTQSSQLGYFRSQPLVSFTSHISAVDSLDSLSLSLNFGDPDYAEDDSRITHFLWHCHGSMCISSIETLLELALNSSSVFFSANVTAELADLSPVLINVTVCNEYPRCVTVSTAFEVVTGARPSVELSTPLNPDGLIGSVQKSARIQLQVFSSLEFTYDFSLMVNEAEVFDTNVVSSFDETQVLIRPNVLAEMFDDSTCATLSVTVENDYYVSSDSIEICLLQAPFGGQITAPIYALPRQRIRVATFDWDEIYADLAYFFTIDDTIVTPVSAVTNLTLLVPGGANSSIEVCAVARSVIFGSESVCIDVAINETTTPNTVLSDIISSPPNFSHPVEAFANVSECLNVLLARVIISPESVIQIVRALIYGVESFNVADCNDGVTLESAIHAISQLSSVPMLGINRTLTSKLGQVIKNTVHSVTQQSKFDSPRAIQEALFSMSNFIDFSGSQYIGMTTDQRSKAKVSVASSIQDIHSLVKSNLFCGDPAVAVTSNKIEMYNFRGNASSTFALSSASAVTFESQMGLDCVDLQSSTYIRPNVPLLLGETTSELFGPLLSLDLYDPTTNARLDITGSELSFTFTISNLEDIPSDISCAFWDAFGSFWNTSGLSVTSRTNTSVSCRSTHFSFFSILVNPEDPPDTDPPGSGGGIDWNSILFWTVLVCCVCLSVVCITRCTGPKPDAYAVPKGVIQTELNEMKMEGNRLRMELRRSRLMTQLYELDELC